MAAASLNGPRRGPRPKGVDTRAVILAAAATVFSREGYERGSVRAVAREAGVDPALIRHYFESKTDLFVESLRPAIDLEQQAAFLASGDPDRVGERLLKFMLSIWEDPARGPRLLQILHAALVHEDVAVFVRGLIVEGVIARVARAVGAPDPLTAASMTMSQMMGLAMMRYAARIEPLSSMSGEQLVALYAPTVTGLLRGTTLPPTSPTS